MVLGLFKSRTERTEQPQARESMSPMEYHTYDMGMRQRNQVTGDAGRISKKLARTPQKFGAPNLMETSAMRGLTRDVSAANKLTNHGIGITGRAVGDARSGVNRAMAGLEGNFANVTNPLEGVRHSYDGVTDQYGDVMGEYAGLPMDGADMDGTYARFEDPYIDDVVDTTLDGMRFEAQLERQQRLSSEAAIGGSSSSRAGVADALAQRLTGMNMGEMEAGLRSDAFRMARELGMDEADLLAQMADTRGRARMGVGDARTNRDLDIASGKSNFALDRARSLTSARQAAADSRTGIGFRRADNAISLGDMALQQGSQLDSLATSKFGRNEKRRTAQAGLGALNRTIGDNNREARRVAPRDATSWYSGILGGNRAMDSVITPIPDTVEKKPSIFGQVAGLASQGLGAYLSAASDERAKEDVTPLDDDAMLDALRGTPVRGYRYREGFGHRPDKTRGLMAQDVEKAGLDGVVFEDENGVKHVDLYPLLSTVVGAVRALDDRTRVNAGLG